MLGQDENGALLVVSHTFEELSDEEALVPRAPTCVRRTS
jgi:hypothetical protein